MEAGLASGLISVEWRRCLFSWLPFSLSMDALKLET